MISESERRFVVGGGVVSVALIALCTMVGGDRAQVFVDAVGAFGQVAVAVAVYFLTRAQFEHDRSEASRSWQREDREREKQALIDARQCLSAARGVLRPASSRDSAERIRQLAVAMEGHYSAEVDTDLRILADMAPRVASGDQGEAATVRDRTIYYATCKRLEKNFREAAQPHAA